ncbi:DNA translocase FtsK [Aquimarina algiphila]|uniref:DNA translocase FtsK n=1 Tax=Aquimarina algiphila TaxID=2047982 RepID=UPI00232E7DEF|nr:DNA translocase FtsK [Aquimarina algiphila]
MERDNLLDEAIKFAKQEGKIGSAKLQLRFKLGYNSATRLMLQMEESGILDDKNIGKYWIDRSVTI